MVQGSRFIVHGSLTGLAGPYRHVNNWLLFARGQKNTASIIRRSCTFDTKIYPFLVARNSMPVRQLKLFKKFDFCSEVSAFLVDFLPQRTQRTQRIQ